MLPVLSTESWGGRAKGVAGDSRRTGHGGIFLQPFPFFCLFSSPAAQRAALRSAGSLGLA